MADAQLSPGDFPVVLTLPVQWSDQDAMGHVNNTVVIRWFESGRIAYFEKLGIDATHSKYRPILAAISCNYRSQMHYPGEVQIGTRVTRIGTTSCTMQHAVFFGDALAADGESVVVNFDYSNNKPQKIDEDLRNRIDQLES